MSATITDVQGSDGNDTPPARQASTGLPAERAMMSSTVMTGTISLTAIPGRTPSPAGMAMMCFMAALATIY
jgi:hypothetical protein